jgi:hypothetical protein
MQCPGAAPQSKRLDDHASPEEKEHVTTHAHVPGMMVVQMHSSMG